MSDSHTDKIGSERSDQLRESMLESMGFGDGAPPPEFDWLGETSSSPSVDEETASTNAFRTSDQTTVPKQMLNDLAAQKITAYLPGGTYRIRAGSTTCNAVSRSELARLICVGAISDDDELMHEDGGWQAFANHPALDNVRNMFGSDLAAILA